MKLMKIHLASVFFILIVASSTGTMSAQTDKFNDIIAALDKGNAAKLSTYFAPTLEIVLLEQSDTYAKQKASAIIADFFAKNTVTKGFQVVHNGTKDSTSFIIGNLTTNGGVYRVYVLVRNSETPIIQQLRIEL